MDCRSRVVCVTGASGYVASWLVKLLLLNGYTVKGTVRDLGKAGKVAHLKALEGAQERLLLFEADLIEEGSLDSILHDCVGLFHTASPVLYSITDPQQWYWLAKTLAEQTAVKYAEQNGIDLVVMNPGFVIGPLLQPTLNASSHFILDIIKGKNVFPDYQFVDVRDVASAHVMALEDSSANGRYILVESSVDHYEAVQFLHELVSPSHNNLHQNVTGDLTFKVSKKKAESLGLNFIPMEVSFKDMIESLKHKNFLHIWKRRDQC
ncbi:phenylacetaldehyde reductase-like isoform X2 [Primulina eburnea]|uniref:phenylacetaldehyde reductase-like isoform X2 n=1 Tax=Primulina eburnea TaxID=1245227 RepID=UPI003C6CBED9